ncbi:NAD(P)-binding protein [Aaosphaeria arxii CBS 175.79]|uniref:NAD(P)-binding protein n=1 Tax=Aaosphaeria arxii CBS 175.79 TaxID=1450172 RepID=A0A6A5XVU6_9PLEO|nr:NAD(P)-binding protein [Aaosphaeria arxii CBS 175.79]KAF2016374.1 NAD(P)-binding protein [Aaosphaeria arxii CBS 175.79]
MTHPAPVDVPTRDLFRLDGRTILLSGGAGAVGLCVGKAILESGGDIVLLDVAQSPNAAQWEDIEETAKINNTKAFYYQADVTEAETIPPLFDRIREDVRFPLRGLVACAGISGEGDAVDYDINVFRKILDVNVTGTFLVAQAVGRDMHRANVTGSIVLIASMSGWVSNRGINTSAYNASKSALHQLTRSLAAEWGHPQNTFPGSTPSDTNPNPSMEPRKAYPPIRVNSLSPGHIETPISEAARKRGLTDEWARQNMLGRVSQVQEFRAPCLFLLGEGSSYMTGADLRVDGGHCAW